MLRNKSVCSAIAALVLVTGCSRSPEERYRHHAEAGRKLLAAKDYNRAVLEFKNALSIKPTDSEVNYQLGMSYLAIGDWKLASTYLHRATDLNSKHTQAQVRLSAMFSESDNPAAIEEARRRMREVLAVSPGDADALTVLGISEWKLDDPVDAERHLKEAFAKKTGSVSPAVALAKIKVLAGKFDEAEAVLKESVAQSPASALAATVLGEYYLLRQRKKEAKVEFERALKLDPKQALAMRYLTSVLISDGKMGEAEDLSKRTATLPDKQYLSTHAMFLFETGRKEQAIVEMEQLSREHPEDARLRDQFLAMLIATDQISRAEQMLNGVIGKSSNDPHVLLQRAALYIALQRLDEAEKDLQRVLYLRSNSAHGQFLYSKLHEARGYYLSQRQALNDALRYDSHFLPARLSLARLLTSRNAAKTALQVLEETPDEQKRLLVVSVERNWAYLAMGKYAEVERSLSAELKSSSPDIEILVATLRLLQSRTAEAREIARKLMEKDPEDVRSLEIISRSYALEKNPDAAVRELAEYAAKRPKSARLQRLIGTILSSFGRRAEARAAFLQALQVQPHDIDAQLALAQIDIAEGKLEDATQSLQHIAKNSSNLAVSFWLGNLNLLKGNNKAAIEHYRAVLELDPNQVLALNNLAWLLAEDEKQIDQALGLAQKAAELSPDNAAVQNTLGRIFYNKGLYTMAVRHLERAVASGSNSMRDFYLGAAYLKGGDRAKGEARLQAVVRQYPNSREAKQASQLITR